MAAQSLGVVLDPRRSGFGRSEGVDAEKVGQGAVVNGEGLGGLERPDQFKPVSPGVRDSSRWTFGSLP